MFQNAGDVNNDGKDDLIIGAPDWNSVIGRAFVVYGQSQCPMKMHLSGNGTCKNCTLGNGCLNCSGIDGTCTICPNGKVVSGSGCVNSSNVEHSSSHKQQKQSSAKGIVQVEERELELEESLELLLVEELH